MNRANEQRLQTIMNSLWAAGHTTHNQASAKNGDNENSVRFVTISRQAGAGGKSLAHKLANVLNQDMAEAEHWCAWDGELVDRVAADHHIRREFVEALEDSDHRWFSEIVATFLPDQPGEFKVYRRVATTIRALASAGHAILVGRGGVFVTSGLAGGLHVRLVAPHDFRVRRMSERLHVTLDEAAKRVNQIDHNRTAFYHHYWPAKSVAPENFALTLNTAELSEAQMVNCLLPLIRGQNQHSPSDSGSNSSFGQKRTGTVHGGAFQNT